MTHKFAKLTVFFSVVALVLSSCSTESVVIEEGEVLTISQVTDLKADFLAETKPADLKARFESTSVSAEEYLWSFPGGTPSSSSDKDVPLVKYEKTGEYTVTLKVTNGSVSDTYSAKIQL